MRTYEPRRSSGLAVVLAAGLAVACVESDPAGPDDAPAAGVARTAEAGSAPGTALDLSGEWLWTREEHLTIPAAWAFIFGIQPEGPITQFHCHVEGVITLAQVGNTLSGVEIETDSRCETRGGQVFPQPGLGVSIPIPEGQVVGRTVTLLIGDPVVSCPIHAIVEETEGGRAVALRGTGRCIIPGHPKSEAPDGSPLDLDPPPKGTEKILTWTATRAP